MDSSPRKRKVDRTDTTAPDAKASNIKKEIVLQEESSKEDTSQSEDLPGWQSIATAAPLPEKWSMQAQPIPSPSFSSQSTQEQQPPFVWPSTDVLVPLKDQFYIAVPGGKWLGIHESTSGGCIRQILESVFRLDSVRELCTPVVFERIDGMHHAIDNIHDTLPMPEDIRYRYFRVRVQTVAHSNQSVFFDTLKF